MKNTYGDISELFTLSLNKHNILSSRYTMLREEEDSLTGNDRYEGYAIDLIFELSLLLEFSYTFIEEEDGNYGVCVDEHNNRWTGMIGKVMSGVRKKINVWCGENALQCTYIAGGRYSNH